MSCSGTAAVAPAATAAEAGWVPSPALLRMHTGTSGSCCGPTAALPCSRAAGMQAPDTAVSVAAVEPAGATWAARGPTRSAPRALQLPQCLSALAASTGLPHNARPAPTPAAATVLPAPAAAVLGVTAAAAHSAAAAATSQASTEPQLPTSSAIAGLDCTVLESLGLAGLPAVTTPGTSAGGAARTATSNSVEVVTSYERAEPGRKKPYTKAGKDLQLLHDQVGWAWHAAA